MDRQSSPPCSTPLPAKFTFVVQFGADAKTNQQLTGRVEHVVSGQQRRFANFEELVAALTAMLASAAETTP